MSVIMFPESMKERIFNQLLNFYKILKKPQRILFSLILFLLITFLARIGIMGEEVRKLAKLVLPFHISYIDSNKTRLEVFSSFEYQGTEKYKSIKIGGTYKSGDIMSIKYTTNIDCWILVVSVSNTGVQPMLDTGLVPIKYQPFAEKSYDVIDFMLDDNEGLERYFIFASKRKFTYQSDIAPFINNTGEVAQSSKGAILINNVSVPEHIIYESVYFFHI